MQIKATVITLHPQDGYSQNRNFKMSDRYEEIRSLRTVGGIIKQCTRKQYEKKKKTKKENSMEGPQKAKNRATVRSTVPFLGVYPGALKSGS